MINFQKVLGFILLLIRPVSSFNLPPSELTTPKSSVTATARRNFLLAFPTVTVSSWSVLSSPAYALFGQNKDRRQLELCLVNVIRLQYWAETLVYVLENPESTIAQRKSAYLEARLGGKAVVAEKQKVGGGGSLKVFTLKGLQIKDCLKDLKYYASAQKKNTKQMDRLNDELIEALASLVEFDGLESTQDPSPRSSLTLGMYNADKENYVRRMLSERIIGLTSDVVDVFGPTTREQCQQYVSEFYPNDLPPKKMIANEIIATEQS